jgi:hypothetical protein
VSSIVKREPPQETSLVTAGQARAELEAARLRVEAALERLEQESALGARVRGAVRTSPLLTLGGAFLVGWAVARLLPRRRKHKEIA